MCFVRWNVFIFYCFFKFIYIKAAGWYYCGQKNKCLSKSHNFTALHLYKHTYKTICCVGVWDREVLTKCQCVLLWHVCNANKYFLPTSTNKNVLLTCICIISNRKHRRFFSFPVSSEDILLTVMSQEKMSLPWI